MDHNAVGDKVLGGWLGQVVNGLLAEVVEAGKGILAMTHRPGIPGHQEVVPGQLPGRHIISIDRENPVIGGQFQFTAGLSA